MQRNDEIELMEVVGKETSRKVQLPPELWQLYVLPQQSFEAQLAMRASCRQFRDMIDQPPMQALIRSLGEKEARKLRQRVFNATRKEIIKRFECLCWGSGNEVYNKYIDGVRISRILPRNIVYGGIPLFLIYIVVTFTVLSKNPMTDNPMTDIGIIMGLAFGGGIAALVLGTLIASAVTYWTLEYYPPYVANQAEIQFRRQFGLFDQQPIVSEIVIPELTVKPV